VILVLGALGGSSLVSCAAAHDVIKEYTLRTTASMGEARAAHSATALTDGSVLILGGFSSDETDLAGAELYDQQSERFVRIAQPRVRRQSHTATRLPDGKVLIAGGRGEGQEYLDTAEVYDPATNTFSMTGRMTTARSNHEAALLTDGRVLVVGGVGVAWTFLASAEIYDPRTNSFTATGSMSEPRESHVAVELDDGRVLVVGGHRGRGGATVISRTAEIYDAVSGRFESTGVMTTRRHATRQEDTGRSQEVTGTARLAGQFSAAAQLPSGRFLITGGYGQGRGPRADAWLIDSPLASDNTTSR